MMHCPKLSLLFIRFLRNSAFERGGGQLQETRVNTYGEALSSERPVTDGFLQPDMLYTKAESLVR